MFIPIEESYHIALPGHEDRAYRRLVDEELREMLVDDRLGFEVEVEVEVGTEPFVASRALTNCRRPERRAGSATDARGR